MLGLPKNGSACEIEAVVIFVIKTCDLQNNIIKHLIDRFFQQPIVFVTKNVNEKAIGSQKSIFVFHKPHFFG